MADHRLSRIFVSFLFKFSSEATSTSKENKGISAGIRQQIICIAEGAHSPFTAEKAWQRDMIIPSTACLFVSMYFPQDNPN